MVAQIPYRSEAVLVADSVAGFVLIWCLAILIHRHYSVPRWIHPTACVACCLLAWSESPFTVVIVTFTTFVRPLSIEFLWSSNTLPLTLLSLSLWRRSRMESVSLMTVFLIQSAISSMFNNCVVSIHTISGTLRIVASGVGKTAVACTMATRTEMSKSIWAPH